MVYFSLQSKSEVIVLSDNPQKIFNMGKTTKKLLFQRLCNFNGGATYDEAVQLATCMIVSNSATYNMLMNFVEEQNPTDEYHFTFYFESVARLVALSDEDLERYRHSHRNRLRNRYHYRHLHERMCRLARAIRSILESEEEQV